MMRKTGQLIPFLLLLAFLFAFPSVAFAQDETPPPDETVTDDEVNALIGQPPGTPLPAGRTKWQVVMEQLNLDLEMIPIAYDASWQDGDDPATAVYDIANFEVVEPAARP